MSSFWETFRDAGWVSFAVLLTASLTFTLGLVTLIGTLAAGKARVWPWLAGLALLVAGLGMTLGGGGTWLLRRKVDDALLGADIDWTSLERIYVQGFQEARAASVVALMFMTVPLLLVGIAAALSVVRTRNAAGARPKAELTMVVIAAGFALLGTVSSLAGLRSGDEIARTRAVAVMKTALAKDLARSDCDSCKSLGEALAWRGANQLETDVPGARERARKCVAEWLADIDAGKRRAGKACRGSDHPWEAEREEPEALPELPMPPDAGAEPGGSPGSEARARALREAAEFGMIGLLGSSPDAPRAGSRRKSELEALRDSPLLIDDAQHKQVSDLIALEEAKAAQPPSPDGSLGLGGLEGSGGGLGNGDAKGKKATVRMGATTVNGRLPPEVIQRIVRQNYGRFRLCYENGLRTNPKLQGRVTVRFVIGRDGSVSNVANGGSDLPDSAVVACVTRAFQGLSFPQPEGGVVTVSYPIIFSPGD